MVLLELWWGKLVGLMLGTMLAGMPGLGLGLLLGHVFDERRRMEAYAPRAWRGCRLPADDRLILAAAFALLGRVARLGGPHAAPGLLASLLDELDLGASQRARAREIFETGRSEALPVRALLRCLCHGEPATHERRQWLLRRLWWAARAGGAARPGQQRFLDQLARHLELNAELGRPSAGEASGASGSAGTGSSGLGQGVAEAFVCLGIGAAAPVAEIKRAYRRAVARHHPDRLLAHGASAPEIREATQRTWEIRSAYNEVRSARGF